VRYRSSSRCSRATDDTAPRLSILQRGDISALVAVPLPSAGRIADVLQHIVTGVRAGSRLDPPGTGRPTFDDPSGYEAFVR